MDFHFLQYDRLDTLSRLKREKKMLDEILKHASKPSTEVVRRKANNEVKTKKKIMFLHRAWSQASPKTAFTLRFLKTW